MNKELLKNLYCVFSPSGNEKKMRKFVKRYINRTCLDVTIEQDKFGNLFVTKGTAETYPCLAAHLDQVQHKHSKDFECVEGKDVIFGYSHKSREQQGLGADDKNGIYICLECLAKYDTLKVAFFVGEETGCVGSSKCDLKFFEDCRFIIEPDRRGGDDLITSMYCGDVCSEEFIEAIKPDEFGYSEEIGTVTDVGELVERGVGISCLNLSCGYYEAHTDCEFTVLSELQNCLDFVCHIIETCTDVYPFVSRGRYGYSWGATSHKHSHDAMSKAYYDWYDYDRGYDWRDYYDYESEAYELMEGLLKAYPQVTCEEAIEYMGVDLLDHMTEYQLKNIYDDVKCYLLEQSENEIEEEEIPTSVVKTA